MPQQSKKMVLTRKVLGRGAFGEVVQGLWKNDPVAIKILNKGNEAVEERVLGEIAIHRSLQHPNIVAFIHASTHHQKFYIVLELMTGGTLSSLLYNKTIPLTQEISKSIIGNILAGLDYLHGLDILHRDIKSQNVLLNSEMLAKISDFGLAIKSSKGINRFHLAGTLSRLAPELLGPSPRNYTTKTDIYAFGILVLEVFRREPPYPGKCRIEISTGVQKGMRDAIPPGTPDVFATIIGDCRAHRPDKRPSTGKIMAMLVTTGSHPVTPSPIVPIVLNESDKARLPTSHEAPQRAIREPQHVLTFFPRKKYTNGVEHSLEDQRSQCCPTKCIIL